MHLYGTKPPKHVRDGETWYNTTNQKLYSACIEGSYWISQDGQSRLKFREGTIVHGNEDITDSWRLVILEREIKAINMYLKRISNDLSKLDRRLVDQNYRFSTLLCDRVAKDKQDE